MIRQITIDELPRLEAVALEFYGSSQFLEDFNIGRFSDIWRGFIERGFGVIFIEERNGEIAGTIGAVAHPDGYGEKLVVAEMFWFVRAACRGGGIALYRALERWARTLGAASIQMIHLMDLMPEKVADFYLRDGFHPVEMRYVKGLA